MPTYRIEYEWSLPAFEDIEAKDFASADKQAEKRLKKAMPKNGRGKKIHDLFEIKPGPKPGRK